MVVYISNTYKYSALYVAIEHSIVAKNRGWSYCLYVVGLQCFTRPKGQFHLKQCDDHSNSLSRINPGDFYFVITLNLDGKILHLLLIVQFRLLLHLSDAYTTIYLNASLAGLLY